MNWSGYPSDDSKGVLNIDSASNQVLNDKDVEFFLVWNGFMLPKANDKSRWEYLWKVIWVVQVWLSLGFFIAGTVIFVIILSPICSGRDNFSNCVILFQMYSVLPIIWNEKRIFSKKSEEIPDMTIFSGCARECMRFWVLNICLFLVVEVCFVLFNLPYIPLASLIILAISLYPITFGQALALFFVLIQVYYVKSKIENTINRVENQSMTLQDFVNDRTEINKISRRTQWSVLILFCVAVMNCIAIIFDILISERSSILDLFINIVDIFCLYGREAIILLYLVPVIVAINESSDRLNRILSRAKWRSHVENDRLSILLANMNEPLGFRLFGFRITRVGVLAHILGFVASLLIVIVRSIILTI